MRPQPTPACHLPGLPPEQLLDAEALTHAEPAALLRGVRNVLPVVIAFYLCIAWLCGWLDGFIALVK